MELTTPLPERMIDALALARAGGVHPDAVAVRLGVTTRHLRNLAKDPHHAHRVRLAVYELLAERERLEAMWR